MPTPHPPYDPDDAFAELAARGYASVGGDHEARLARLRIRTRGRGRRAWRWVATAAAACLALALVIAYLSYEPTSAPVAAELPVPAPSPEPLPEASVELSDAAPEAFAKTSDGKAGAPAEGAKAAKSAKAIEPPAVQGGARVQAGGERDGNVVEDAPEAPDRLTFGYAESREARPAQDEAPEVPLPDTSAARSSPAARAARTRSATADDAFDLERAPPVKLREVVVRVTGAGGQPIEGATLRTEQPPLRQALTTPDDALRLMVPPGAAVGVITAPDYDTARLDLTRAPRYDVQLARGGRPARVSAGLIPVDPLPARAHDHPAFDDYVRDAPVTLDSATAVTVQFAVNRRGRPREIRRGPGPQDPQAYAEAKRLLRAGPDWPEAYRRRSWRYVVRFGESRTAPNGD